MDLLTQFEEVDSEGKGEEILVCDILIALPAVDTSGGNDKASYRERMHSTGHPGKTRLNAVGWSSNLRRT